MIKVLVAEDQLLIQKDICRKIEKTGKDVQIVGTAIDGGDAYEKIRKLNPNVLITDIRMPGQDGLSLIRRLKEEGFHMYTVILSGYRDFDYAKEAIKLGVDDYLLKPVSIEDLRFVLDLVEEKMNARRDQALLSSIEELMASRTPADPDYASYFPFQYYYMFSLNLDSYYTFSVQDTLPFEEQLEALLAGPVLSKYMKRNERYYIVNGTSCNEKLILFCLNSTTEEKLSMLAGELIREIEHFTQAATVCISNKLTELSGIGLNRQLLRTQTRNQLTYAHSSLLYGRDFLGLKKSHLHLLNKARLEQFQFYIHTQNLKDFFGELNSFLSVCDEKRTAQRELEAYLKRILEYCFASAGHAKLSNLRLEIEEYISNSRTYGELYTSLSFLFEQLYQSYILNKRSSSNPEKLVEEIRRFIQDNFSRDININDIAEHFSITPAYLSRLFKKHSDVKPIEFLMDCRMKQACQYFLESSLSVREVAELCGYSNQYYFSKAFKQVTSYSPSEYRIRFQKD